MMTRKQANGDEDDGPEGVGGGDDWGDGGEDDEREGGEGDEVAAKACPAPSRTRKTECRMNSQDRCPSQGELVEGGGSSPNVHGFYIAARIARRTVRGARRQRQSVHKGTSSMCYGSSEYRRTRS
jgi:hypothetical protein